MKVVLFPTTDGWCVKIVADNNDVLITSSPYDSRSTARKVAKLLSSNKKSLRLEEESEQK